MILTDKLKESDQTKTKQIFYVCLPSLSDENKKSKETESIFCYGCIILITFFFLCDSFLFALVCFVHFWEHI